MKQLSLFSHAPESAKTWTLYVDGASKHNPGPAGAGVYLLNADRVIVKQGFYLGAITNNQAEYIALLLGVWYASRSMARYDTLTIFSDSQLLVRQIGGKYKVKNHIIARLYHAVQCLLEQLSYGIHHLVREENTIADALANEGLKKKVPLPAEFLAVYNHILPS